MSIKHMCVSSFLAVCICVMSSRVRIFSVQFLPFQKPACSLDRIWRFSRCCAIYHFNILSRTLAQKFIRDMGLWLFVEPFFCLGYKSYIRLVEFMWDVGSFPYFLNDVHCHFLGWHTSCLDEFRYNPVCSRCFFLRHCSGESDYIQPVQWVEL